MGQLPARYFDTPSGRSLTKHMRIQKATQPNGWWLCDRCSYRANTGNVIACSMSMGWGPCAGCKQDRYGVWFYDKRYSQGFIDARWWIVTDRDENGEMVAVSVVQGFDKWGAKDQAVKVRPWHARKDTTTDGPYRSDVVPQRVPRYQKLSKDEVLALASGLGESD